VRNRATTAQFNRSIANNISQVEQVQRKTENSNYIRSFTQLNSQITYFV
jgi:hypothetical protein